MRILAPESELPFAGHPVLGTAFVVSAALGKSEPGLRVVDFGAMPMVTQSTDRYVYYRP